MYIHYTHKCMFMCCLILLYIAICSPSFSVDLYIGVHLYIYCPNINCMYVHVGNMYTVLGICTYMYVHTCTVLT